MIYFNGTEFVPHTLKLTYFNRLDNVERTQYDSSKDYWEAFADRWDFMENLVWTDIVLSDDEQGRLDILNQQENLCGQYDSQASLFVSKGAILPVNTPPFLDEIATQFEAKTLAYAVEEFKQTFESLSELENFLLSESE